MRNEGNFIHFNGQFIDKWSTLAFIILLYLFVPYAYMELLYCYSSEVICVYKTHHTLKITKGEKKVTQFIQTVSKGKSDGLFEIFYIFFQGKGMWNFI